MLLFWNYVKIKSYKEESEKSLWLVWFGFVYLFILLQSDFLKNVYAVASSLKTLEWLPLG